MTQKTQKKGFSLEKLTQNTVFLSVISLILSLLVAGLVMMIAGYSPIEGYSAMFIGAFGSVDNIAQTLGTATPLIFAGLAMAFAARGGMFNIGIEGQIIAGAMPAALVGAYCSGLPWFIHVPLCFVAGMIGGGLWAMLAGFLKNKLRVSEVILTIMLNYVMQYLAEYLANYQFKAEGMLVRTETILPSAELPTLIPYSRLTTGIFVALAFAVFVWWFLPHHAGVSDARHCAESYAAEAGGINIARMNLLTMFLSGALAGMGGAVEVMGVHHYFIVNMTSGYGFDGVAIAVMGNNTPLGTVISALIFGALRAGSTSMNRMTSIPGEFIQVLQALVIIFVSTPGIVRALLRRRSFKKNDQKKGA